MAALGIEGITVSPGYAYERAPDQQHFLNREKTKTAVPATFLRWAGAARRGLSSNRSSSSTSSPAIKPINARHGAIRPARSSAGSGPVILLGEGYAASFKELMEETDWDSYGTGNYEKCADCMVHCGFEATAVEDAFNHPLRALGVSLRGIRTEGPMAPDIPLHLQRPAEYVFSRHVEQKLAEIGESERFRQSIFRPRNRAMKAALRILGDPHQLRDLAAGHAQKRAADRAEAQASRPVSSPRGRHAAAAGAPDRRRREKPRRADYVSGGDPGRDMGFHVGGKGACLEMQGALFRMAARAAHQSRDVGDRRAAESTGQPLRPDRIAVIAGAVRGDDRAGDKLRSRRKSRRQPARDAKTDDGRSFPFATAASKARRETRGVTAAREE